MTNEQILKLAIEKAVKNGLTPMAATWARELADDRLEAAFLFSHNFAKCFFGEAFYPRDNEHINGDDPEWAEKATREWQYHLQQLALSEDRLAYIKQFIDNG